MGLGQRPEAAERACRVFAISDLSNDIEIDIGHRQRLDGIAMQAAVVLAPV
ncbi:hypothetical protein [Roseovarius sp.]|uniref:hypothetical protein n=1 Tax=Roseovarius sp. TaxID=1486281 RepID=UPI0035632769